MENFNDENYERFKREICERCDILYDLKRRENIILKIFNEYEEVEVESRDTEIKYELGAEGARSTFKNKCMYVDRCDEVKEAIDRVAGYEDRLSKLLYELMVRDREKDVYYISADVDPFYPMLSNRIVRSNRARKEVLKDKYDTKDIIEKFKVTDNNNQK